MNKCGETQSDSFDSYKEIILKEKAVIENGKIVKLCLRNLKGYKTKRRAIESCHNRCVLWNYILEGNSKSLRIIIKWRMREMDDES